MIEIKKIDRDGETYRILLDTPKGFARMWITEDEYHKEKIGRISSNVAEYLEGYKDNIQDQLKKFKNYNG